MQQLEEIADQIREQMEQTNAARDLAYQRSRELTRVCARAIRAVHREEWNLARELMDEARLAARAMIDGVQEFPVLYYAGYTQDALKEYAEANLTYQLVRDEPLLTPAELALEDNTWLNGLAEAAGELGEDQFESVREVDCVGRCHRFHVPRSIDMPILQLVERQAPSEIPGEVMTNCLL